MTWIDDADSEVQELDARKRLILEEEERIYADLWKEITTQIDDAKRITRFREIATNGGPLSRVIKLPVPGGMRSVTVELTKQYHRIIANGTGGKLTFQIDVCPDRVVCLMLEKEQLSLRDAAIKILSPVLFPELIGRASSGWTVW